MVEITLGIIGGGQLGSLLASAAKKINIKTVIFSDDQDAPGQKFSDDFVFGKYNDENKINEFVEKVDLVTFEFENIPFETLSKINKVKKVLPKPDINKIIEKSKSWAKFIAEELDFIGTLCVEYFIDKKDNLYVNEIAPRVHNSGHLTINSHNISQFENHIRAVCGLKKKETKKLFNAKMINLIGNDILIYRNKKFNDNEFFFDYLKKEIKSKRKMGHLTILKK